MRGRGIGLVIGGLSILCSTVELAHAITLFGTSFEGQRLFRYDTSTNMTTTVLNTAAGADSMVFDSSGRIIYSPEFTNTLRRFDPGTNTDSLLAPVPGLPSDLALEPDGSTVLVSTTGGVRRVTSSGMVTSVFTGGATTGLVYDNTGRLFVNVGGFTNPTSFLAELDPLTGVILQQSASLNGLDGLTFDAGTGTLFAASFPGNGIYAVDPNNLANVTFIPNTVAGFAQPDGIVAGGDGHLYFAARSGFGLLRYDIANNAFAALTTIFGIDDLAPASGPGAPPNQPVPEPATWVGLLTGLLGTLGWARWQRVQRRQAH